MKELILMLVGLCAFAAVELKAVTVELWPAERRRDNTAYLIGNEQNHLMFDISNISNLGVHKIDLPNKITNQVTLTVDLPQKIKFLGAAVFTAKDFCSDVKNEVVKHHGITYNRYVIPLNRDENIANRLENRVIKNKWYYYTLIWVQSPANFNGKVYWNLKYGDETLAEASSNMQTIGTIDPDLKLPKKFKWNVSAGLISTVPGNDYRHFADFCKRLGINSASFNYAGKLSAQSKAFYTALREAGIVNIANRGGSFGQYLSGSFRAPTTMATGGLEVATAMAAKNINSEHERRLFKDVAQYFDEYNFDYEPAGPHEWPGWEDENTITAFAKKLGLAKNPTVNELKGKYQKAYSDYRMELLSRPIFALKEMISTVKPMDIIVEQGSGVNTHVDYKFYDEAVRWHGPMIYTSSPLAYYQRVLAMTNYLNPKKVMPVNSFGWRTAGVTRHSPQDMVMDTVGTAATGCGGISHWPGLLWTDAGQFYGFFKGLTIVAHGEDFYFDGKPCKEFTIKGLPFKSKKVNLGFKVLDISQPDWKNSLYSHEHKLNDETLITILNFNQEHDAFVEIKGKSINGKYLVNPVDKIYSKCDSNYATIKVPKFSPALWIVTSNEKRIADCRELQQNSVVDDYNATKKEFLATSGKSELQLGSKGEIDINYGQVEFGGRNNVALNVHTPAQTISFGNSGGRIISWNTKNKQFVGGKNFSVDGFGMDLLWLPVGSRWSGDEVSDMRLTKCLNDGKNAIVEYEGEFTKGLPHVRIIKTYTVPMIGSTVKVNVRLINDRPLPVTVSYWSHNVLFDTEYSFSSGKTKYSQGGDSIFIAKNLPEEFKQFIVMPKSIKGDINNQYTELEQDSGSTVTFTLPENFLNVYRWRSSTSKMSGSEWMTQPITIPAGTGVDIGFDITVSLGNQ